MIPVIFVKQLHKNDRDHGVGSFSLAECLDFLGLLRR